MTLRLQQRTWSIIFLASTATCLFLSVHFGLPWTVERPSCHAEVAVRLSPWLTMLGPIAFLLPICGAPLQSIYSPFGVFTLCHFLVLAITPWIPGRRIMLLFWIAWAVWFFIGSFVFFAASQG